MSDVVLLIVDIRHPVSGCDHTGLRGKKIKCKKRRIRPLEGDTVNNINANVLRLRKQMFQKES